MDAEKVISNISSRAYDEKLRIVNTVKSVNCKEWENEKKLLRELEHEKKILDRQNTDTMITTSKMATRYYLQIEYDSDQIPKGIAIGHADFRPDYNSISDAFLPIPQNKNYVITCKKAYKTEDPARPFIVTVPYTMLDPHISLCSPPSIWIVLAILDAEFRKESISLYEIIKNLPINRRKPSPLNIKDFFKLFDKYDYLPHVYIGNKLKRTYDNCDKIISECPNKNIKHKCHEILNILYKAHTREHDLNILPIMDSKVLFSYIGSEIPVYLHFLTRDLKEELKYTGDINNEEFHSVVAIGYNLDENYNVSDFIVHDVGFSPFVKISKKFVDTKLINSLVLLPNDMRIRFEVYENQIGKLKKYLHNFDECFEEDSNPKFRSYLMSSQKIKFWFTNSMLYPLEICEMYSQADFPKYVWLFELNFSERGDSTTCRAHIIFDATLNNDIDPYIDPDDCLTSSGIILAIFPKFNFSIQNGKKVKSHRNKPIYEFLHAFKTPKL